MTSGDYYKGLEETYKASQALLHFYNENIFDETLMAGFHDKLVECRKAINSSSFFVPEETMERLEEQEGELNEEELQEAQHMIDCINLTIFAYHAYNEKETETTLNNFFVSVTASVQDYDEEEIRLYINLKMSALQTALNAAGGPIVDGAKKKEILEDHFPANSTKYYLAADKRYNSVIRSRLKAVRNQLVKQSAFEILETHPDTSKERIEDQLSEYIKARFKILNPASVSNPKASSVSHEESVVPEEEPVVPEEEIVVSDEEPILPDEEPVVSDEEPILRDEEPVDFEEETVIPVEEAADTDNETDEQGLSTQGRKRVNNSQEESRSSKKSKPSIFDTQENARTIAQEEIFDPEFDADPQHQPIEMEALESTPSNPPQNVAEQFQNDAEDEEEEVDELADDEDDPPVIPEVIPEVITASDDDNASYVPDVIETSEVDEDDNTSPEQERPRRRGRPSRAAPAQAKHQSPTREPLPLLPQPVPEKIPRRPRIRVTVGKWTPDEVAALEEGLLREKAPSWSFIIAGSKGRLDRRTGVHCKDKARNMIKAFIKAGIVDPEQWGAYKYVQNPVHIPGHDLD